ncbi:hypothetical protein LJB42_000886 [Komagataella kurtzmanii]|nr:hypothetical protein LJB42_000886 [Komagataella kurtzmanii]
MSESSSISLVGNTNVAASSVVESLTSLVSDLSTVAESEATAASVTSSLHETSAASNSTNAAAMVPVPVNFAKLKLIAVVLGLVGAGALLGCI